MAGNVAHFSSDDIKLLFKDKHIAVIGDSVQRSVYKDLVCLLRDDQLLTLEELKEKGELTFQEDTLVEGGVITGLHNGTNYREVRKYEQEDTGTTVMFYFVTRCYGEYMQEILNEFKLDPPHVIIMNSCLWDLHRYGKSANPEYIENISKLLHAVDLAVPDEDHLFIWNATLPVRETVKAGFLPPGVDHTLPADDIRKANFYVRDQLKIYGERFIFLDLHQIFYKHLKLRVKDGVHWNDFAHRKITFLLLSEICKHWNFEVPSKSPMSPVADVVYTVSNGLPANVDPQHLLPKTTPPSQNIDHIGSGLPTNGPPRNRPMDNGVRMNGFRGNFPRGHGPPGPNANVRPTVSVPSGPIGPRGPRASGPRGPPGPRTPALGPRGTPRNGPPGERPLSNLRKGLLGNAPPGNVRGLVGNGLGKRSGRRGTRSATVGSIRLPPPPCGWPNGSSRFTNNNEFLRPGFSLNDTFPPASSRKRKFLDDFQNQNTYKFPRKFL